MYIRFPIIVALNKADCRGETDNNILKIMKRYNKDNIDKNSKDHMKVRDTVVISAASECFMKKLAQQRYIHYERGDRLFLTREDEMEMKGTSVRIILFNLLKISFYHYFYNHYFYHPIQSSELYRNFEPWMQPCKVVWTRSWIWCYSALAQPVYGR